MKKLLITVLSASLLIACSQEKSVEERYIYQDDKIIDVDTGDEYLLEETDEEFVLVHKDGSKETVAIDETPFFGTALTDDYVSDWKSKMEERQENLLIEKKNQLKEKRKDRYSELSDDELLEKFQKSHKEGVDMTMQMDMIAELVERGRISNEEAPELLEIEPELLNLEIDIEAPSEL
ncbi:hypothetical protein MM213_09135 [Belliella sp. R4-6]|uniref:Uncharacterized protein n=1 Tax=Belliella alkalica TaxID=1730871 RepID=A0ABS9VB32_9BACT|nr:hypothetical protein [Belliella alkalica]MCH7413647.1 hypothetical protein [Belliella alkalica]